MANALAAVYPQIKAIHVAAVVASGMLFTLRGLLAIAGSGLARAIAVRRLSYGIDATLLAAAAALCVATSQYPFADAWLTAKIGLLVGYILLGWQALHGHHGRSGRTRYFAAALAAFALIVTIARHHDAVGRLASMLQP